MGLARLTRHALATRRRLEHAFDAETRRAIEEAVTASERSHRGELRFAVEARLGLGALLAGESAQSRALDVFANLGVWDTEENSGILVYVLLADHHVAIVADRGYTGRVDDAEWKAVCSGMEAAFRRGAFREGAIEGILGAARLATRVFPMDGANPDELPNAVVFL